MIEVIPIVAMQNSRNVIIVDVNEQSRNRQMAFGWVCAYRAQAAGLEEPNAVALGVELVVAENGDVAPPEAALLPLAPVLQPGQLYVLPELLNGDDDRADVFVELLPTHPGQFAAVEFDADLGIAGVAAALDVDGEGPQFVQVNESLPVKPLEKVRAVLA